MGRDVIPDNTVLANVDAPIVVAAADALAGAAIAGKALVIRYVPPATAPAGPVSRIRMPCPRFARGCGGFNAASRHRVRPRSSRFVADEYKDQWDRTAYSFPRGTYGLDPDGTADPRIANRGVPLLYVKESALGGPLAEGAKLVASIFTDSFQYPSVNIIAKVPGSDPALRDEYVLFSAHQDHDGVRYAVDGDDIWNGADDNASTAVALLAIGRAVVCRPAQAIGTLHLARLRRARPDGLALVREASDGAADLNRCVPQRRHDRPKRSGHGGATRRDGTASQLARAGRHGARGQHVGDEVHDRFVLGRSPAPRRLVLPERSPVLCAQRRAGVVFTTLLHPDYHSPRDNPDRIDLAKLTRMTRWMYATGRIVADTAKRPAVDPNFKLERCRDSTGDYCGR